MKAVFLDFATVAFDDLDLTPLTNETPGVEFFDHTKPGDVAGRVSKAEFVFLNKARMTRDIIENAPSVRFIGLVATGVDNVDLDAARERDIAVCNIRAYCTQSVVEHVAAVMLSWSRSLGQYTAAVRNGRWQLADNFCFLDFPIRELSSMTLGIIGYGELGRGVADLGRALGMHVLVARRQGAPADDNDGRTSLPELLKQSDVVSLHCPLTSETRNLIAADQFAQMKSDALLINTARGALVDSGALLNVLSTGKLGAAAIDVLTHEPPASGDPLLDYDGENLMLTPHIAWASTVSRQNAINELAVNVRSFNEGGDRNRVV